MRFIVVVCSFLLIPSASFAYCAQARESEAFEIRALQSSMMVAALSCNQHSQYNQFIRNYKSDIASGGKDIKSYFERAYGSKYEYELNKFITNLANRATKLSMEDDPDEYCDHTLAIFNSLNSSKVDLEEFLEQEKYATLHGVNACS